MQASAGVEDKTFFFSRSHILTPQLFKVVVMQGQIASIYVHTPVHTAEIWKISILLFPEIIFIYH